MLTTNIINDLITRYRRRRTRITLTELSDYQLRDIGLTRHDLSDPGARL